ncbi:major facilitator superfamily domain-containing protein [Parasitella parasitica]|nr:major facilitator superfamily domain-containing protein [Parasitella parasitica]
MEAETKDYTTARQNCSEMSDSKTVHFEGQSVHVDEKAGSSNEQYDEHGNQINFTMSEVEIRLVRKLDYRFVMPYIAILNFLQFFDKSALNYSGVLGIMDTASLTFKQFSWLGSIFYLGYLLFQGPSMILIQKLALKRYIGSVIILWGLVLLMTFLGHTFSQLAALRFLLGFFEAGIYPCCIVLISSLYRRKEQAGRIGIVYICNGIALGFGGLIGYGIGSMDGAGGLRAWQWIMIILGSVTILFGIISFFFMVDSPKASVLGLTLEEEKVVDARMRDNAVVRSRQVKISHIYESLKEPRFYIFCLCSMLINFQNSVLNTYSSIITKGFGFTSLSAILLSIPSGITDCFFIVVAVWYNRRYGNTLYGACAFLCTAIIGILLLVVIPVAKAKLLGLYLTWAYAAGFVLLLVSVANNVAGYTKKVFYSSSIMVFYTFGNFIGPFFMVESQAPLFVGGMVGCMVANAATIILFIYARWEMAKENRRRMAGSVEMEEVAPDMTDVENKSFIYRL